MEAEPRLPWGTRTPRAPPYLPGAQLRLLHCPQLHPLLAGAGPGCRLPAHQSPAHSRCGPAILQPPKRAMCYCTWHVLFLFPLNATSWCLLPQGGRGRRQTPSWKHSGRRGVLQEGNRHRAWCALVKPENPRNINNIIVLVAPRMGLGPNLAG